MACAAPDWKRAVGHGQQLDEQVDEQAVACHAAVLAVARMLVDEDKRRPGHGTCMYAAAGPAGL